MQSGILKRLICSEFRGIGISGVRGDPLLQLVAIVKKHCKSLIKEWTYHIKSLYGCKYKRTSLWSHLNVFVSFFHCSNYKVIAVSNSGALLRMTPSYPIFSTSLTHFEVRKSSTWYVILSSKRWRPTKCPTHKNQNNKIQNKS